MSFYETYDGVFWITVATILTGSLGLAIKYCLKSKCDNVSCCWGCLLLHRNVLIEHDEEIKEMELHRSTSSGGTESPHFP